MEVEIIKLSVKSTEKEVVEFLSQLQNILKQNDFNVNRDLRIIKSKKDEKDIRYSTPYTMVDLEYDDSDVTARLSELTIRDYCETLVDKDDVNPPLLFVFGKDIKGKQIYIKLKIKGNERKRILCVSFHYAKEKMMFPYA